MAIRVGFELYKVGIIDPKWVGAKEMPADILMKPLGRVELRRFMGMGGLVGLKQDDNRRVSKDWV